MKDSYISFNTNMSNTVHLKQRDQKQWISFFGTKIVAKGCYKRWQIKIQNVTGSVSRKSKTAKCFIGIVDIDSLNERERGRAIQCQFWMLPYFGYAFGEKGRKYHIDKKGMSYSKKIKIGDVVTVELNRTCN